MSKRPRRAFTPEFKAQIAELIRSSGRSVGEVSRDLDLAETAGRRWLHQTEIDAGHREGLTTTDREELTRLRKEVRIPREERAIRKKAASHRAVLAAHGVRQSVGRPGTCWDNAEAESFFATLKQEMLYRQPWPTRRAAQPAIFGFIAGGYNPRRRHSALSYRSPAEVERRYRSATLAA